MNCLSYAYNMFNMLVVSDGISSINLGGLQAGLEGGLWGQSPQEFWSVDLVEFVIF